MPNIPNQAPTYIAYLWTKLDDDGEVSLRETLFSAPRLPGLRVQPYFDHRSKTVFLRLQYRAISSKRMELRIWAEVEGIRVSEPDTWPAARHLAFAADLARFRCDKRDCDASASLTRLARQLEAVIGQGMQAERSASGMFRTAIPTTVELSPSMQTAVSAYLATMPTRSDGVPELMEITESMVVDVRMLTAPVARATMP